MIQNTKQHHEMTFRAWPWELQRILCLGIRSETMVEKITDWTDIRVYVRMDDDEAGIIIVGRNLGLYVTC